MKTLVPIIVLTLAALTHWEARAATASPVELKGGETPQQMTEAFGKAIQPLLPELAKGDAKALEALEAAVHQAARPGAEAERLACCGAIVKLLPTAPNTETKIWLIKQLQNIGRAESVLALDRMLYDPDAWLRETARCALQNNPAPEAAAALRLALTKATDSKWQAALALALGARKDEASVIPIAALLQQKDEALQTAAIKALGDIGSVHAAQALEAERKSLPASLRIVSAEAWMKCAERMIEERRNAEAAVVYKQLNTPQEPRPVRLAALHGALRAAGDQAGDLILEHLAGDDQDAREVATACIYELSTGAANALVRGVGKLPPEGRTLVVGLLASRGEKAVLSLAPGMAASQDESERKVGLQVLGLMGDNAAVPILLQALWEGGECAAEARASLVMLSGVGIDKRLMGSMMASTDPQQKSALIEILEARGAHEAVPGLLSEAAKPEAAVRRSAIRALGKVGAPEDVSAMIKLLLGSAAGGDRSEVEKSVASVCGRIPEKERQAEPVLSAYEQASPAEKALLLPVLGRIGGERAFKAIKAELADGEGAMAEAAQQALYNWPEATDTVADELLALAKKAAKPADRQSTLRAYIRVASMRDGFPDKVRFERLQKAMELADRDQERNLVLEKMADLKRIETVRYLMPYLDNPALNVRAGNSIVELARDRGLRERNRPEIDQALNRVIATTKDKGLADRAKRQLEEK